MNRRLPVGIRRRLAPQLFFQLPPDLLLDRSQKQWLRCALWGLLAINALVACMPSQSQAADLSRDIRTASDVGPFKAEITSYVQAQLAIIALDQDSKTTSAARESLIDEVRGLVEPSASFLDAYESELQTQISALASSPSVRVRLNAAIAVAAVAAKTQDAQLAQLVIAELSDANEAVVLWGLKAAREVIPPALGVPNLKVQLLAAVIKAAQRLGTGPIISTAYDALAVGDKANQSPADLIVPMQNLLAWRIQQYAGSLPPEPPADGRATSFLTQRVVWRALPAQQKVTAQLIVDLIGAATADLGTAQTEEQDELGALLAQVAKAIQVVGLNTADTALVTAATPLTTVTNHTAPASIAAAATSAINGLATKFPGLKMPKGFVAPSSAPSTTAKSTP